MKFTVGRAQPLSASHAVTARMASPPAVAVPSKRPLFTITPSPAYAAFATSPPVITSRTSSPIARANSQSRSSWPGTAMMAPVP